MPKVVESFRTNTAKLDLAKPSASSSRKLAPRKDSDQSFKTALEKAKPKPTVTPEPKVGAKPEPDVVKADAPAEEPVAANAPAGQKPKGKPQDESPEAADQTDPESTTSAEKPDANAPPVAADDAEPAPVAEDADVPKPATEKPVASVDASDPAVLAAAVAEQVAVAPTTPQSVKDDVTQPEGTKKTEAAKPTPATATRPDGKPVARAALKAAKAVPSHALEQGTDVPEDAVDATDSHEQTPIDLVDQAIAQDEPAEQPSAKHASPSPKASLSDATATDATDTAPEKVKARPQKAAQIDQSAIAQFAQAVDAPTDSDSPDVPTPAQHDSSSPILALTADPAPAAKTATPAAQAASPAPPPPPVPPEVEFASANHEKIVSSVHGQLLPNGGTMHIRLDPPELGPMQVTVRMIDGAMNASFETSSDKATSLLSHSLGQLKQSLESQGVSVERLHVQQSPRDQQSGSSNEDQQHRPGPEDQSSARREQQRQEILRRMWARLGVGHDPLDMVA